MKANDFVKKYGLDLAKEYVNECPSYCNYLHEHGFYKISETWQLNEKHILVSDLKRLVKSHELVEFYNGLDKAKKKLSTEQGEPYYNYSQQLVDSLKQAITDVESCM